MRRPNNSSKTFVGMPRNAVLTAALLTPLFLYGQQNKPKAPNASPARNSAAAGDSSGDAVFSSDTRLVPLNETVMYKNCHLITNLPESAFHVYENGVQQQIKLFKREDVPVSMGLIIDNSGSMREKRAGVESAALALVKDSNAQDEVFVVNFNDEIWIDQDFTGDISLMEKGLTKIDSRGGTAMRDALWRSVEHLKQGAKRDKKVILVVTDGNDNASVTSLDSLTRLAQQDDVLIYGIGLLTDEDKKEAKKARRALDILAESTGGQVFYPKDVASVERIAHEVAHDIRNQFTIAYTPSDTALDGTYRQIKVTVKGPGNPVARTRSGYYATKEQSKESQKTARKEQ